MQSKAPERHTLTALVDNEAGVLARVVGLFPVAATTSKA
jgi:acetolactate synthase small subunit